jgi:hypothetical protein
MDWMYNRLIADAVVAQLVCVSRVGSFGPGLFAYHGL